MTIRTTGGYDAVVPEAPVWLDPGRMISSKLKLSSRHETPRERVLGWSMVKHSDTGPWTRSSCAWSARQRLVATESSLCLNSAST